MATGSLTSSEEYRAVLPDLLPEQGGWSEEEYLVLTDPTRRLVEYTDGYLEVLPGPTDRHQTLLKRCFRLFGAYAERTGGIVLFAPLRCGCGRANFENPTSSCSKTRRTRAVPIVSGPEQTSFWKWSARTGRNATWSKNARTTPRPAFRNTGSSTPASKPCACGACSKGVTRKSAAGGADEPPCRTS